MNKQEFWDPEISTASRDKIAAVQLENLKKTLWHCYNNNSFYKKRIDEAGLNPDKLKDLQRY